MPNLPPASSPAFDPELTQRMPEAMIAEAKAAQLITLPLDPTIREGSKIGLHVPYMPGQSLSFVRQAVERGVTWALVKGVDNAGVALDVKAISPRTLTITRFVRAEADAAQDVHLWSDTRLEAEAQAAVQIIFDRTNEQERQAADWFEVLNEADPEGLVGYFRFGVLCRRIAEIATARGVRIALPAFNAGTPEYLEMKAFVESGVCAALRAGNHLLTTHEGTFGQARVETGYGNLIPGAPSVPAGSGSLNFRYRYLYSLIPVAERPWLVVSEWYSFFSYGRDPSLAVEALSWYDRGLRQDPYVLAVTPFTLAGAESGWAAQDYTPVYGAVLNYVAQQRGLPNHLFPDPTPVTMDTHTVTATALNVRAHPWSGEVQPAKVGLLTHGEPVTAYEVFKTDWMRHGWACISRDGNKWVSMQYLREI